MTQLVIFRAVQGCGAGGLIPLALAVIGNIVPPRDRGRYQGLIGAVFAAASIIGPAVGGFIVDNTSWRWIFYVNLPVGGARARRHLDHDAAAARRDAARDRLGRRARCSRPRRPRCCSGSSGAGAQYAWDSPQVTGALALAVVLAVAFGLWERRVDGADPAVRRPAEPDRAVERRSAWR